MVQVQPNGRVAYDHNFGSQVGTNLDRKPTTYIRLVMEVSISGDTKIISVYPL
jgi:hypothetical protein